jgi:uncharacterized protein (TIGR03437 family)
MNARRVSALPVLLMGSVAALAQTSAHYTLLGWNDLGMHCMDGDYAIYSILPPYNTIHAQLIDNTGKLVRTGTGITVSYAPVADSSGSINTASQWKTNFWKFAQTLFGTGPAAEMGLAGFSMPGAADQKVAMKFDATKNWFTAEGIPITPYDDNGNKNFYPMMRLTATNSSGTVLATANIVLPVSDEMSCRACHASGARRDTKPAAGWANDGMVERDYKRNILRLHDDRQAGSSLYAAALEAVGYSGSGLAATAEGGHPILCAACHASNALSAAGQPGIPQLTASIHNWHAHVTDLDTGLTLDDQNNRDTCYRCHPGSTTRCLRGAMGTAVAADGSMAMQCQSCHGNMSKVGASSRQGWLDEPDCQSCHTGTATINSGGIRLTSVFDSSGNMRTPADTRFATNANTPASGLSLFRFSTGHGGLACEACHGSTHAESPSSHANDNVQSIALQGYAGPLGECTVCHSTISTSGAINGGPHTMHIVGNTWLNQHPRNVSSACQSCHGSDYRGTVLSRAFTSRTLNAFGGRQVFRGATVGCWLCHNGPNTDNTNNSTAPTATSVSASTATGTPVKITLPFSSGTVRIVDQPDSGTVALAGNVATYTPLAGTEGVDKFTFASYDNQKNSNLATGTVTVTAAGRPAISAGGIGNAANYIASSVAPGEIVAIFGTGLGPDTLAPLELNSAGWVARALSGTRVLFDGMPAPLWYASSGVVTAIAPYSLTAGATTQVQVEYNGIKSTALAMPVTAAVPGIFTLNASGSGQAVVLNQDQVTFNSAQNPAAKNSVITVIATGGGAVDQTVIDGSVTGLPLPKLKQSVTATVGGVDAAVEYSGPAPSLVAGVLQVNIRIPAGAPSGSSVPVVITVGGVASQKSPTIAVQ